MSLWWGYKHINGSLHLKRYFSPLATEEAGKSSFVKIVYPPFEAESRQAAARALSSLEQKDRGDHEPKS